MKYLITLLLTIILPLSSAFGSGHAVPPAPTFVERAMTSELMERVRKGGYVLYMRHGLTDNSRPDRLPNVDLNDCNTQRLLSDAGRELIKKVGMGMREAKIPFSRVLVSPMCRTKESAQLAVGDKFEIYEPLMFSVNMTSEEKKQRTEALKKLILEPIPAGGNTLLVAHAPNMEGVIGFFVKPEGNVLVLRQDGAGGFEYLASIHPNDWGPLAR